MYGCTDDASLKELFESDLKSASDSDFNFMTDLANMPLLAEDGFDDFAFLDGTGDRLLDPYGLTLGLGNLAAFTPGNRNTFALDTNGNSTNHHHRSSNGGQNGGTKVSATGNNLESWKMQSNLMNGLNFEENFGILVDPSSIVPVSVSSSVASSASGSETDPDCLATDEEDENDIIQGQISGAWIVPDQTGSRSPSPIGETEFDMDEPEFILTEAIPEGPPPKKRKQKHEPQPHTDGKIYPKPGFSYSCLIAMSLKNSKTGCLPVSEIYKFMCDHFPYFKSAPSGWKNSVRHNLSLNKCFEKIEKPGTGTNPGARKGCLWALNPAKIHKMDEEVQKWSRKDPLSIRRAMSDPENMELIERGELKRDYSGTGNSDEDDEEDFSGPATPAQLQARRSRQGSADSMGSVGDGKTPKLMVKSNEDLEFAVQNVQGGYSSFHPNTYSISFANSTTTPLIIRRTPVK